MLRQKLNKVEIFCLRQAVYSFLSGETQLQRGRARAEARERKVRNDNRYGRNERPDGSS